ncbi:tetratricopeptide repeat protein [Sphingorhabdus lutea]|nr:tetratricopeptide repeat protein [Sphingorhabdus lutea]
MDFSIADCAIKDKMDRFETLKELIMRFSPAAIGMSLMLALVSSGLNAVQRDDVISARALVYVGQAKVAIDDQNWQLAIDNLETALALHPRNANAYNMLAQIMEKQGLLGKSIRYYRESLDIDPNGQEALIGQGLVYVKRGAVERAKDNLSRYEFLCRKKCDAKEKLNLAINTYGMEKAKPVEDVQLRPTAKAQ